MKPLLICDCDEVLLHMVRHFGDWLDEAHDIDFKPEGGSFESSMRRRPSGDTVPAEEMWSLLGGFFPGQMKRQTLAPGADTALAAIAKVADIVILTNLPDQCQQDRIEQLSAHGIAHRVECNQGGKGPPVARLVAEYGASTTVFVDDLAVHHASVAEHAPDVFRLHMICEPTLARHVPPAPSAHVRIDEWEAAQSWILDRFAGAPAGLAEKDRTER